MITVSLAERQAYLLCLAIRKYLRGQHTGWASEDEAQLISAEDLIRLALHEHGREEIPI